MNHLPAAVTLLLVLATLGGIGFVWYYFSPRYTDVGYRPKQPVAYSHKLHAGDLGMDCRYCHTGVEVSAHAGVPPTQTCMNCHKLILPNSEKLLPVRESFANNIPIAWVKIHKIPDYAYFRHDVHVRAGVGCETCHGVISEMEIVMQKKPLSMGWCLDCHRHPDPYLRPAAFVTTMNYQFPANQLEVAKQIKNEKNRKPPTDCSGCHR